MSSDRTLEKLLDEICLMAQRKVEGNKKLPEGEKLGSAGPGYGRGRGGL